MCFEKDVYYHDLTNNTKYVMSIRDLEYYEDADVFLTASNSFCPEECGLS